MILYLDTSSLVKLYLDEEHSDLVREWVESAEAVATSLVAYPEALSALARRRQAEDISAEGFALVREAFESDWPSFVLLLLNERRAGGLAVKHLLRGFDAIHLSAVLDLIELLTAESIVFSAFDAKLLDAARVEGIPSLLRLSEPP